MSNRKGLIKISGSMHLYLYDEISGLFKEVKPIHIEYKIWEDMWYLHGVSDSFADLAEARPIPEYSVIFTRHDNGGNEFTFNKV